MDAGSRDRNRYIPVQRGAAGSHPSPASALIAHAHKPPSAPFKGHSAIKVSDSLVAWERAKFQLRERDNFLSQPARGSSSVWERWWKNLGTLSNRKYLLSIEGVCADKINTVWRQCSALFFKRLWNEKDPIGESSNYGIFLQIKLWNIYLSTLLLWLSLPMKNVYALSFTTGWMFPVYFFPRIFAANWNIFIEAQLQ